MTYTADELFVIAFICFALLFMCAFDALLTRWPGEKRLARWLRLDWGE